MREPVLAKLPKLKFIAVAATGYDVIDLEACRNLRITVSNVRGYAVNAVPEHTIALILALRRGLLRNRQVVLGGRWQRSGRFCFPAQPIHDLAGARIGVIEQAR
ncbi:MAG: hypothetical protein V6Z86_04190 [Hyphomicrobiales bacterium]